MAASGRFLLRVDPALHQRLRELARRRGCSLNRLCAELLERALTPTETPGPACQIASDVVPAAVLRRLRAELGEQLAGIALFGSVARGESWDRSDVDLLVVLVSGAPITRELYQRWDAVAQAEAIPGGRNLELHFVSLPRSPEAAGGLWLEVALEGVLLHDPHLEVARMLARLRQQIAAGHVVRRLSHGRPYWVRSTRSA
jgi:hypothetical protein